MSVRAQVRRQCSEGDPIVWPEAGDRVSLPAPAAPPALVAGEKKSQAETARASETAVEAAQQKAFREGEVAGRAQAQAELRGVLEQLTRAARELAALRPRLREQAEDDLIRLAVAIARRVVRRELTVDPQTITGLVKAALEQLAAGETACLRVHPEHETMVRRLLAEGGRSSITVAADPGLERGAALFETARGNLDASADRQLAEIEHGLTDGLRRHA